jgi:hypothetical protein
MKTIENLEQGEMLLASAKKVKGGKIQLHFAQKIDNPNVRPQSIVGLLNASDDRFTQTGKPRHAWVSAQPEDASKLFGLDFSSLTAEGQEMEINKLSPSINGQALNIQITETTQGNEYEVANFETMAKRAGKDGDYILTKDGEYIYVRASVVPGNASHAFLADTVRSSSFVGTDAAIEDAIG